MSSAGFVGMITVAVRSSPEDRKLEVPDVERSGHSPLDRSASGAAWWFASPAVSFSLVSSADFVHPTNEISAIEENQAEPRITASNQEVDCNGAPWIRRNPRLEAFNVGAFLGLGHLAISCALAPCVLTATAEFRDVVLLLYPWSFCALGVGARYLPERWLSGRARVEALLLPLFALLSLLFLGLPSWTTWLMFFLLTTWFFFNGGRLVGALRGVTGEPGPVWASHIGGLAVGYGASILLVESVGPLVVLLVLGLAWLGRGLWVPVILILSLSAAAVGGLQDQLEMSRIGPEARSGSQRIDKVYDAKRAGLPFFDAETSEPETGNIWSFADLDAPVWRDWSRFGLFWLVEGRALDQATPGVVSRWAMYNFWPQWRMFETAPTENQVSRAAIYHALRPTDRVLIAGIGGGAGLWRLAPVQTLFAVERNPSAVKLINERPDWSGSVFENVTLLNMDGRAAFDLAAKESLDAIIIESARHHSPETLRRMGAMHLMYTAESAESIARALKPDGFAMLFFHDVRMKVQDRSSIGMRAEGMLPRSADRRSVYLLFQMKYAFEALGFHTLTVALPSVDRQQGEHMIYLLASKQPEMLEQRFGYLRQLDGGWLSLSGKMATLPSLTDDLPFASWIVMSKAVKRNVHLFVLTTLVAALFAIGLLGFSRWRAGRALRPVGFFSLLGFGYILVEAATIYRCRALLQDEVQTLLTALPMLLAWATIGSLNVKRLASWPPLHLVGLLVMGFGAHVLLLDILPFRNAELWVRYVVLALALLPGGLLLGLLMPLGLERYQEPGDALLFDCVGTLLGAALILPLCFYLGITGTLCTGLSLLVLAAFVLPKATTGAP